MKLINTTPNLIFKYILGILVLFASFIMAMSFPKYSSMPYMLIVVYFVEFYTCYILSQMSEKAGLCRKVIRVILSMGASFFVVISAAVLCFYSYVYWSPLMQSIFVAILIVLIIPKMLLGIFLLINDSIYFLSRKRIKRINVWTKISLGLSAMALFILLYGIFFTRHHIEAAHKEIYVPNLPKEFDKLKIVQFSDLHLGGWYSEATVQKTVALINAQNPDIVFFTGDLVTLSTKETEGYDTILSKIKSKFGVYSVLGNHDYGGYIQWASHSARDMNLHELMGFQERIGWKLLMNQSVEIKIDTSRIIISGVENWGDASRFPKLADINKALSKMDVNGTIVLLLSHDPTYWNYAIRDKHPEIPVTFSGHTHGMQVGIRFSKNGENILKNCFPYLEGLYQNRKKTQQLFINRGIGSVGYPGRLGLGPEISVITLHVNP